MIRNSVSYQTHLLIWSLNYIAEDDDWMSTVQDLPHRIQEAFRIVEAVNGEVD